MKKWLLPKIVAALALAWILIWILWTALLYILSPKQEINPDTNKEIKLSPDQLKQLKDITWTWAKK
jgi:hypothetical protein